MNWTKPNFTQWVTIITLTASAIGYVWHSENERIDSKLRQHDFEQRVDSIGNQLNLLYTRFETLRANREVTLKANAEKDKVLDERADKQELDLTVLSTEFHDYLKYKK